MDFTAVEIFVQKLNGEFSHFPAGFCTENNAIKIFKWLIEKELLWSDEEIRSHYSQEIFDNYDLLSILAMCFDGSPYKAINGVYPGVYKEWELPNVPKNFWTQENAIRAVKWLIEEKLQWSDEEIKHQFSTETFKENRLYPMLRVCFDGSPYKAIDTAYPGKYNLFELSCRPKGFWTYENSIAAVKWLVEEKLKWTVEEAKAKISYSIFKDNNMSYMLSKHFHSSPLEALKATYPEHFINDSKYLKAS